MDTFSMTIDFSYDQLKRFVLEEPEDFLNYIQTGYGNLVQDYVNDRLEDFQEWVTGGIR